MTRDFGSRFSRMNGTNWFHPLSTNHHKKIRPMGARTISKSDQSPAITYMTVWMGRCLERAHANAKNHPPINIGLDLYKLCTDQLIRRDKAFRKHRRFNAPRIFFIQNQSLSTAWLLTEAYHHLTKTKCVPGGSAVQKLFKLSNKLIPHSTLSQKDQLD